MTSLMSTTKLLILGAIAGSTIFVGLPVGRLARPLPRTRAGLNAVAIGILLFLLYDVLSHANEPVESALTAASTGEGTWARFAWLAFVFAGGVGLGLLSLVYYDRRLAASARRVGPGAATAAEMRGGLLSRLSEPSRLALFIALGIGLHNFSEGLAIGQSSARGEVNLAAVLVIGFALHNGTEGFGIVAPFAGSDERPSWPFLLLAGLIGGGPTFVGTVIGNTVVNDTLFLAFLALAAGSILYVVVQLLKMAARLGQTEVLMWGLLIGLVLGFGTDYVLVLAGS
jgi:ZIP family zinc transporter